MSTIDPARDTAHAAHAVHAPVDPEFYGDHPALDLLNTVVQQNGAPVDLWQTDADVLRWLTRQHLNAEEHMPARLKTGALLSAARVLRETVRAAIGRRKSNQPVDIDALNAFLAEARRHIELALNDRHDRHELRIVEHYEAGTAAQVLAPLAEAAAELLVNGDFNLVRECEHPDCTMCFYDRTKSHRRRWCSMALCGNRNKVASFRRRQHQADVQDAG